MVMMSLMCSTFFCSWASSVQDEIIAENQVKPFLRESGLKLSPVFDEAHVTIQALSPQFGANHFCVVRIILQMQNSRGRRFNRGFHSVAASELRCKISAN